MLWSRSRGACPSRTTTPHPRNRKGEKSDDRPWAAPPTPLSSYDFHGLLRRGRGWLPGPVEMPGGDTRGRRLSQALAIIPERFLGRLAFPPARGMKSLLLHNPTGLGFPPGAPHLPDEWLPLGGVEEQASSQAFIERPVGAMRVGAADAGILGTEQRVSAFPGRPWPLPPGRLA